MNVTASRSVSAIFMRTITTDKRRRQKEDVESLSHSASDLVDGIAPML
eukprot:CAMPEP_0181352218 /NCGR_PEP_ID=MMETSP1106-20121128/2190_1 /TAXON_ID=81844 /ORGANISM="Mantoniella antarctica, Strain SL-175" /LENGTH=47 /DNA_ID= /DNA_START= /DNA_END= /DNA_ORIENTATION=